MSKKKKVIIIKEEENKPGGIDYFNRFCQLCGVCIGVDFDSDAYKEPNGEFKVCLACCRYLKKSDLYILVPGGGKKEGKVRSGKRRSKLEEQLKKQDFIIELPDPSK